MDLSGFARSSCAQRASGANAGLMREEPEKENRHFFETEETARKRIEQARSLKEQAKTGGLRFETYLVPGLAEWVLDMVERGDFVDPSEAVFVYMQQAQELEPHHDLKQELLGRRIKEAMKDERRYTAEEVFAEIDKITESQTEPAYWKKIPPNSPDS